MKARKKTRKKNIHEIHDYDTTDTLSLVDLSNPLKFKDVGLSLPPVPPTQVVSIRLPSELLNELRALGTERDVGYQALVKMFLSEAVRELKAKTKKPRAA